MAYFSTAPAPGRRTLTAKNRVWDFFRLSNETHLAKRRQPAQPRRKIRPVPTKTVSGIPYWPARDPIGERGGMNLYGFVANDGVDRYDQLGLSPRETTCFGTCGADIDDWIMDEVNAQIKGWMEFKRKMSGKATIENYLMWANGNQRYKDADFFEFSKNTPCGTRLVESQPGCGKSVTLCGKCVRSSILGNIIFGLVGGADFTLDTLSQATDTKKKYHLPVDPYDNASYRLGLELTGDIGANNDVELPTTKESLCRRFTALVARNPDALKEGTGKGDDYNSLEVCRPCKHKTREKRHGGSSPARILP
jgi:hypothetical protein